MAPTYSIGSASLIHTLNMTDFDTFDNDKDRYDALIAARKLCSRLERSTDFQLRMAWTEPNRTMAIKLAWDSGLLKALGAAHGEARTTAELTKAADLEDVEFAYRVLKSLGTQDFITEVAADTYKTNRVSQSFVQDSTVIGALDWIYDFGYQLALKTPEYMKSVAYHIPKDPPENFFYAMNSGGENFFQYMEQRKDVGSRFHNHMAGYAKGRPGWVDQYPTEDIVAGLHAVMLVDIGGGVGHDLMRFKAKHPEVKGRLVLQETDKVIGQAVVDKDVETMVHDFFTKQPIQGARVYFMHSVLHDWAHANCVQILSHIKDAMKPGYSKLLIQDAVVTATRAHPLATTQDIVQMALTGGQERTSEQWQDMVAAAGLKIVVVYPPAAGAYESVLEIEVACDGDDSGVEF